MSFQKILCPSDLSEASLEGLKVAANLAGDGEVVVLHVQNPLVGAEERQLEAEAQRTVEQLLQKLPAQATKRALVRTGEAADSIVSAAYELGADLVVLTSHGATGFRCGELGAVAETVLQSAPCPVLVINGPASGKGACDIAQAREMLARRDGAMRPAIETAHSGPHALFLDGD